MDSTLAPVRFVFVAALTALALSFARAAFPAPAPVTPADAIGRAVARRFGGHVTVVVTALDTAVAGEPGLEALPDPAARTGRPVRYALVSNGIRRGAAVASVKVLGQFARAARAIDRGESITESALAVVDGELPDAPFARLPQAQDVVGLTARRAIAPGEPLTPAVLVVPPVVRSGDRVTVNITLGHVQATGTGIASGSGQVGDIVRVLQPDSRVPLRAKIVGPGTVEVVR